MTGLSKDTILQRAFDLDISIRSNTDIELTVNGLKFRGNDYTLAVLNVFSSPKPFHDGVDELAGIIKGPQAWIELTWHITQLFDAGILCEWNSQNPRILSHYGRFDAAEVHVRMLNDHHRTNAFREAIKRIVFPGDVVVEIGMGTGILSAFAVLSGAKHVFAIERTHNMPKFAQRFFEMNGISDRITIMEGDSINIDLPEKADILISEIVGNDPLGEDILRTTGDAVKRFLKPSAKLIPGNLRIFGLPVSIPEPIISKYFFRPGTASKWQKSYGFDFETFVEISKKQNHSANFNTFDSRDWQVITEPVLLFEIDLKNCPTGEIVSKNCVLVTNSGELNGIIVYFETDLAEGIGFSIHPEKSTPENSWSSKVWMAGTPLVLSAGELIEICYSYTGDRGSEFEVKKM